MVKRKGVIEVSGASEDQIMETALDAGADDVVAEGEIAVIYTDVTAFSAVRDAIEKAKLKIERSGLDFVPDNTVGVSGDDAKTAADLIAALEDQDDVQNVYHNANFPD
jgi:transcriptional/translational regulatory protein YebC/TACO1